MPAYAEAHNNLGVVLKDLGRTDEAVASCRRAIAIKADYAEAHRHLALAKTFADHDADLRAMEAAYTSSGGRDEHKMHLVFGLGKAFEDLRQYDKAFDFFVAGNAIKRATIDFSVDRVEDYFGRLKETFSATFLNRAQAAETCRETPIFVLGMLRSGTSLVEQILSSHPAVYGAGELDCLRHVVQSHFNPSGDSRFTDRIGQADAAEFSAAGRDYMTMLRDRAGGAAFITDKMPHHFEFVGLIKLMLPNAKIVHCCRDGRDTCLSIFKNYFSAEGNFHAYDLAELGRYHGLYDDLMVHWHDLLPGFIHDIQYEDLVADQEAQSRALVDFCGLEWDDACLAFHRSARPVLTASAVQVRAPIHGNSVALWKRYESHLTPLFEALASAGDNRR